MDGVLGQQESLITSIDVPFTAREGETINASVSVLSIAIEPMSFRTILVRNDTGEEVINTQDFLVDPDTEFTNSGSFTMPPRDVTLTARVWHWDTGTQKWVLDQELGDAVGLEEVPGSNISIEDPRVTSRTPVDGEVRLNVAVPVTNTGDAEGTIAVDFSLDGQVKSTLVTVPANSFVDASTFFLKGPGSYELCAEIIGTRNCISVSVAPPGDQGIITAIDVPFLAVPGDRVDASVSMMSVADVSRRFRITLTRKDTGGTVIDDTFTVDSFQERTVQGGFTMPNRDVGLTATLFYELDGEFVEDEVLGDAVGVRPPASANLSISSPEVTSITPIDGDFRVNVAVPVTNTGDASATAAIDISFNGEMKTKRIEVPAGGSTDASTFFIAAPGSYEVCGVLGEERKCSPVAVDGDGDGDGDGVGCPADKIDVAGACFTVGDLVLTGGSLVLGTVAISRLLR